MYNDFSSCEIKSVFKNVFRHSSVVERIAVND